MNQLEHEGNKRDLRQVQENACEQVAIDFGFTSDWLKNWREFSFNRSQSVYKETQTKHHSVENRSMSVKSNSHSLAWKLLSTKLNSIDDHSYVLSLKRLTRSCLHQIFSNRKHAVIQDPNTFVISFQ